jgi:hypothetical protein
MRQRAILYVEDAIREFEQSRVMGHERDGTAVNSGDAGDDGHDRLALGAVERRSKALANNA